MSPKLRMDLGHGVGMHANDATALTSKKPLVTIKDRLEAGNLSVDEVCVLADRSRTGFYADVKAGLVSIRKVGRRSVVPGPIAKRYIAGGEA